MTQRIQMIFSHNFSFQKYIYKIIVVERKTVMQNEITLQHAFIWGLIAEKNKVIMIYEFSFTRKTCTLKELIPKHSKQTWVQHLYVLQKGQDFVPLKSDSHLPKKFFYRLQWKSFKNDEKCFLFHLKSFFVLKIFKF